MGTIGTQSLRGKNPLRGKAPFVSNRPTTPRVASPFSARATPAPSSAASMPAAFHTTEAPKAPEFKALIARRFFQNGMESLQSVDTVKDGLTQLKIAEQYGHPEARSKRIEASRAMELVRQALGG